MMKLINSIIRDTINPFIVRGRVKIFCIGRNKTGTTSLKKSFEDLGFVVGKQRKAERLISSYSRQDFGPIIEYCKTAQVFQDVPFSFPNTFKILDKAYPGAKFILTVRDSPEQWYNSLTQFHAKMFGKGRVPTMNDLQQSSYVWPGWMWECNRLLYNTPLDDIYNKDALIKHYLAYEADVTNYFSARPHDFIKINLAEKGSYQALMNFLDIKSSKEDFPWKNKTADIMTKQ